MNANRLKNALLLLALWWAFDVWVVPAGDAAIEAPLPLRKEQPDEKRLLALGKDLFVGRCAGCHNENGDKPLKDGPPLNERHLSRAVIEKNVASRFSSATDEEKEAVTRYIQSFLKQ